MSETVTGVIESVIYQSPDGSYTVCEIETPSGEPVTVVGQMPMISEGMRINATGEWKDHPTYGRQLRCDAIELIMPENEGDILRYLSSGTVKGVGPKTAIRLVERYGAETFDVIENHPDWLSEIPGISKNKAAAIAESFREAAGARGVIMFFKNICSPAMSMRIYKKWGSSAVERVRANPFSLCRSISGISFGKADELARSIGIPADSPERIESGLLYILEEEARKGGHTCTDETLLAEYGSDLLCIGTDILSRFIDDLISRGKLYHITENGVRYVFAPRYYTAERVIAEKLKELSKMCPSSSRDDIGDFIYRLEASTGLEFADMQKKAIAAALEHGVMILTGGPGTGKTTVTKALLNIFESMGMECALAAPTGRAANRMSEATSHEAQTLHRLLETSFVPDDDEQNSFIRDEHNMLDEDVFILDETSMIDTLLMESFVKAVKPGARLILIGDSDQLPSVGAGNVLGDLIECGCFCTIRLTEIFRQSGESLIVTNAHAVNAGKMPVSGDKDSDFFILRRKTDEQVAATVADLCVRRLPAAYGDDIASRIQVISPSKRGAAGTEEICRMLQERVNPPSPSKRELIRSEGVLREGDRVMQVRNNYNLEWHSGDVDGLGIFNGDVGIIESIDTASGEVSVDYDGKCASYDMSDLDELELSYAITVHKSQGSEYPVVVIPVYGCHPALLNRRLLYTAITRGAKLVVIVAKTGSLEQMVENDAHANRRTGLISRLRLVFGESRGFGE